MKKRKVIEIIKEETLGGYNLQKIKGYDYLNLQEIDFKPSPLNVLTGKVIYEPTLIKKPHNIKVGDVVTIDNTLNVKRILK